ncbi:MAG: hypothetical protein DRO11_05045 [Methanobacteriota archaeon]|nr:MAG: hypothetical protein DRO11_05045 [Euryarchaeota archaeon]
MFWVAVVNGFRCGLPAGVLAGLVSALLSIANREAGRMVTTPTGVVENTPALIFVGALLWGAITGVILGIAYVLLMERLKPGLNPLFVALLYTWTIAFLVLCFAHGRISIPGQSFFYTQAKTILLYTLLGAGLGVGYTHLPKRGEQFDN